MVRWKRGRQAHNYRMPQTDKNDQKPYSAVGSIQQFQDGTLIEFNPFFWSHWGGWCWAKQVVSYFGILRIPCSRISTIHLFCVRHDFSALVLVFNAEN